MNPADVVTKRRRSALHGVTESSVVRGLAAPTMPARGIEIADRSFRARFGVKGPQAESWLGELGFVVPSGANQWAASGDVLVARLATSEFLVESLAENDALVAAAVERLEAESRPLSVYPVGRQDLVLCLRGPAINELLRQTCGVDFAPHLLEPASSSGPLVLTSMIGVGVVAVPRQEAGSVELTLWLDPSFAHYFWTTLTGLISDLAGGESPE